MTWDDPTVWPEPFVDAEHEAVCAAVFDILTIVGKPDGVGVRGPIRDEEGTGEELDAFLLQTPDDLYMVLVKKVEPEESEANKLFNNLQALRVQLEGRGWVGADDPIKPT